VAPTTSSPGRCPFSDTSALAFSHEDFQHVEELFGAAGTAHSHSQGLLGELVDHVEQLEAPEIGGLVELEVEGPYLVGPDKRQPLGQGEPQLGVACGRPGAPFRPSSRQIRRVFLRVTEKPSRRMTECAAFQSERGCA